jgi:hypothetical protein
MIQAGWPADGVLLLTVASINGLKNQESTINAPCRRIRTSCEHWPGCAGFNFQQRGVSRSSDAKNQQTALLTFHRENITPEALPIPRSCAACCD